MAVRLIGVDRVLSKLFRSGNGGALNLVIPKHFAKELDYDDSTRVEIFYNRNTETLEIKKNPTSSSNTTKKKLVNAS